MKFSTLTELEHYITQNYKNLSENLKDLDVSINLKESHCGCHDKTSVTENVVKLTTLFDSPIISNELLESNSDNEIYVNSAEVIKDACGTGKLELFGRSILVNICEMDNIVHVNLDINVNNKDYHNVPFIVKITEKNAYIKLNKALL